jgi:hypothetical protein
MNITETFVPCYYSTIPELLQQCARLAEFRRFRYGIRFLSCALNGWMARLVSLARMCRGVGNNYILDTHSLQFSLQLQLGQLKRA